MSALARNSRSIVGLATAVAALLAATLATAPAAAAPPEAEATQIRIDSIVMDAAELPVTPGTDGLEYAVAGKPTEVKVSFLDAAGALAPLDRNRDLTASVVVVDREGTVVGSGTAPVPAGDETATITFTVAQAVNGVTLTATAPGQRNTTLIEVSDEFDVLETSIEIHPGTTFSQIGGNTTADGCVATEADPVCADLLLPNSSTGNAYLSIGLCDGIARCADSYIQALADLSVGYSATNPATLLMKCDKSLCDVQGGIKSQTLDVQLGPDDRPLTAPACESKGVVNTYDPDLPLSEANAPFCVDYVQSTRDNAGDTHLYLLFTQDAKVRFP